MRITATQTNSRQTPRKVRLVANAVKGMKLEDAIKQLSVIERKSTLVILKVVRQAIANATHNHGYTFDQLELVNILVTGGPSYKRFRAVSRGRAHRIIKRTCHVTVELEAGAEPKKEEAAPKKTKTTASESKVAIEKKTEKVSKKAASPKKSTVKKTATAKKASKK